MPEGTVHAQVRVGRVALTGEVEWDYQKHEIERIVRRVRGVAGINNIIVVTP
jgi:osmotically-inducible protein OsmY